WIENGVLRELAYPRGYANQVLNKPDPLLNSYSFRMSGGDMTIEEMIARTERGLLVTRLANVRVVDYNSLLCTGTTADGLWLIERGEITKPVKNFRFRESPLYVFNSLEALGTPVRVLQQMPTIVPPAMVHDFSMPSPADAVGRKDAPPASGRVDRDRPRGAPGSSARAAPGRPPGRRRPPRPP